MSTYSSDWIGESGLDVEELGYCITFLHKVEPREALRRLGARDAVISDGLWSEVRQVGELGVTAAFTIGDHTVLVEDGGYSALDDDCAAALSQGTEAVTAYLSINADSTLLITRDGQQMMYVDGDSPEHLDGDEDLAVQLRALLPAALQSYDEDGEQPTDFDDGWVDLLQVACDYVGLRPTVADVSGPTAYVPA